MNKWFERLNIILALLIILDIIFLISSFIIKNNLYLRYILIIDSVVCIILILIFLIKLLDSNNKNNYFKENWLDLLASIPLELIILPNFSPDLQFFNIIIMIRVFRILLLLKESSKYSKKLISATYLDKIIAIFIIVVIGSSYTLYYFDPAINSLYDGLWYVFQTITTVGYGDLIPQSPIGKFIGLILLIIGVLTFSLLTASFAYIFNDKVFREENENFNNKVKNIKEHLIETRDSTIDLKNKSENSNKEILYIKDKLNKTENDIRELNEKLDYLINLIEK